MATITDVDGDQATGVRRFVDAQTWHTIDLGVEPSVMVPEEANLRTNAPDQVIEPLGFAGPASPAPMPLEDHTGRRVVDQEHIDAAATDQGIDLFAGVVPRPADRSWTPKRL